MVLFTILKDYIICVNDICNHTDLINSSLGYTTFDDAKTNHTYAELDGNTTIAARAEPGISRSLYT